MSVSQVRVSTIVITHQEITSAAVTEDTICTVQTSISVSVSMKIGVCFSYYQLTDK